MSAIGTRDPFEVADVGAELGLAELGEERAALPLETWVGRALLALALIVVLVADVRLAHDTPNYRPDNEANRVAYVEQLVRHGEPPVLGKDSYEVDPTKPLPPRTVTIRRLAPLSSPSVAADALYPQALALERPYPYYLAVPVSWIVPWNHRIAVLRYLCILLTCAGIAFLWRAVREAWPANPLAAGVAAIVLGTMSGLVEGFAAFQTEALLLTLWCAGMWLVLRDARQRRCSAATVAVWAGATCVSSVAVPAALAAIAYLSLGADAPGERARRLPARLGAALLPTLAWVVWNVHAYGNAWPLNVVAGAPDRVHHWRQLTSVLAPIFEVNHTIFDGLYASGIAPVRNLDERPLSLVALLFVVAMILALCSGRIASARLALARLGALMLGSFACVYLTLFLSSVVGAAPVDYGPSHFGGFAAAWAGLAGVAFTTPLAGYRRLNLTAIAAIVLVLVSAMLRSPVL